MAFTDGHCRTERFRSFITDQGSRLGWGVEFPASSIATGIWVRGIGTAERVARSGTGRAGYAGEGLEFAGSVLRRPVSAGCDAFFDGGASHL